MIKGKIAALEPISFDHGPGVRYVVYLERHANLELTSDELLRKVLKYRHYYEDGGITFAGDLFSQTEFLLACLKLAKTCHLSTALEMSEIPLDDSFEILYDTDLVILCSKDQKIDPKFQEVLKKTKTSIWKKEKS